MSDYLTKHVNTPVAQTEQASPLQVANSAGGFSFQVDQWKKLERFLILGSEGGTYYIGERNLTDSNLSNLKHLTETAPDVVISMAAEISEDGRSYKNDVAIFVLAYVMTVGSDAAKAEARYQMHRIVRTSTHLFTFEKFLKALAPGTGLGTSRNRAIASWYESKSTGDLAYQMVKYRQREGWTHRDSMRQARPKGVDANLASWVLGNDVDGYVLPDIVNGFKLAQGAKSEKDVLAALEIYQNLPWEALPTEFLKSAKIWKRLFYNGQLNGQALVRNITRLARLDAFADLDFAADYASKLANEEMIKKTRLHPINFLNALTVHTEGQVDRKSLNYYGGGSRTKDWQASPVIVDALNAGFHSAFKTIEPTGKRTLISVDVSGSMSGAFALGLDLTAAQVAGAMALTIAKTEQKYQVMGFADQFRELKVFASSSLQDAMRAVQDQNFGRTDCSLPMEWALKNKYSYDTFVVITDNETYAGRRHPHVALQDYRKKMGIDARLIVVGVAANDFTIADPNDSGMLDVAGADSNLPKLIAEFSKGNL